MERRNGYECFSEYASKLIRRKAKQLERSGGGLAEESADLEQDLALRLLRAQSKFDPTRASARTFEARVVANKVASIVDARCAAKRDGGSRQTGGSSADDEMEVFDASDMMAAERERQRRGDLRIDLEHAMAMLPAKHRDICERLKEGSVTDVAASMGIPRTTLYGMVEEVRAHFERAGVRDYLHPDVFCAASVSTQQSPCSPEAPMTETYNFTFEDKAALSDAVETLHLAIFAAEGVHGRAELRRSAAYSIDEGAGTLMVAGATAVARTIMQILSGLLSREFGAGAFTVELVVGEGAP